MDRPRDLGKTPLVRLSGASVTRGGARLLDGVDFALLPGERWALFGANGAGKTTLLRLLRGDIPPDERGGEGSRSYDLPGQGGPQATPLGLRQRLGLVSGDMQDLYARHEWAITGLEAVLTGFFDSPLLYAEPTPAQWERGRSVLAELGLSHLGPRRMSRLSTGQARAVLLARALACRPDALFLDECLEGLDAPARRMFLDALDRAAAAEPRLAMLFCSHRTAELPACLERALLLEDGRVRASGLLAQVLARWDAPAADAAPGAEAAGGAALAPPPLPRGCGFLLRVTDADVSMEGTTVLRGVNWTVRPGEHWAVTGANGAGKSTLLGLLAGDFWPSALEGPPGRVEYGFALPGQCLDETRRRMGRVSPALDRDYGVDLRVDEAVWSGAYGSVGLYADTGRAVQLRAARLMEFFDLSRLAARRIHSLSRGQLRRVMLARALMGQGAGGPVLLLLDEPMAGLDARARRRLRELFSRLADSGVALVMVTHHARDLPGAVNRVLELKDGRVTFSGSREEYENRQASR